MGTHYQGTPDEVRALDTYIKLSRAADTVTARATRHLSEVGLTSSQYGVMDMLFHLGPLSQGQIATKLIRSNGNMTTVVDNLERRGLVERERERPDRRIVTVSLTEAGRALITAILPVHIRAIVDVMAALTPAEQEALSQLCRQVGKAPPTDGVRAGAELAPARR